MKAGWAKRTIDDICVFRGGGTPSKSVASYWKGDIPWVSPKDMKSDIVSDSIDHISEEAIEQSTTSLIPTNSILVVVRSGILARTIPVALTGRDVTINQDIKALCPDGSIDAKFLFYFLKSRLEEMLGLASRGATVHRIMADQIRTMEIHVPPLPEQQRIVGILDEAFEAIATAKANADKNLQNARALFGSHLQSVFTQRGEGWVEKPISDCFKVRSGDFLPAKAMVETGAFDVYGGNGINGRHDQKNLSGRNILIGRVGAKCGNVRYVEGDLWITDNAFFVSEYFHKFDLGFLSRVLARKQLRTTANQAAQPVISYTTIKDVVLEFPADVSAQKRIAEAIETLEAETQRLATLYERKLAALEALKKSLLHQAFNGEL